jgi:hypothetical protein
LEYKQSNKILIPIGRKCEVAIGLRIYHLRKQAYPFDWNIVPISTALELIENRFKDFLAEENLIFLPPIKGRPLNKKNELVTNNDGSILWTVRIPVICKKYNMLFPHDFSEKGIDDLPIVKEKYSRRISRLIKKIDKGEDILFLYDDREIHKANYSMYKSAGIDIKNILSTDNFLNMKNNLNIPMENFISYISRLPSIFTVPSI